MKTKVCRNFHAMLWKEWLGIRSMFLPPNLFLSGVWTLVVLILAFGVYEPIKSGPDWILSPSMLFSSMILIPFCISGTLTPDSFAGERERHTLEPLLATPLSDQVLLYGKLVFPAILGWTAAMMALLAGIFAANNFSLSCNPFMSHFGTILFTGIGSVAFSIFITIIGVAASLHALNVMQAQLKLVTAIFPLLLIPAFLIGPFSPVQLGSFANQLLPSIGLNQLLLWTAAGTMMLNGILILITQVRFHRKELIMD